MSQIGESPAVGAAAAGRASALRKTETKEVERVHPEHEEGTADGAEIKDFLIFIIGAIVIYAVISLLGKSKSAKRRRSAA